MKAMRFCLCFLLLNSCGVDNSDLHIEYNEKPNITPSVTEIKTEDEIVNRICEKNSSIQCENHQLLFENIDGNVYKTTCIDGKIWLAENVRNADVEHFSADGNSDNDMEYGYLYTWENALKACPSGWRLPMKDELLNLICATEERQHMNPTHIIDPSWNIHATNSTGFNALPAGVWWYTNKFGDFGSHTGFWSSTANNDHTSYALWVNMDEAFVDYYITSYEAYSVRCIKEME